MSIRFGIVGGGWRTRFFLRIARELPDYFEVCGVYARRGEVRDELKRDFNIPLCDSLERLIQTNPAFIVVAVSWDSCPIVAEEISVERNIPVLLETPPAPDLEGLKHLMALVKNGAKMQVAEQYLNQPQLAARLQVVNEGLIGEVHHTQVSICHGYHGTSIIRKFLNVGFSTCSLSGWKAVSPLLAPMSREGYPTEKQKMVSSEQAITLFRFENGKTAIFDFCGDQYFSFIRNLRFMARGTHGEINNNKVDYQIDTQSYYTFSLERQSAGEEGNLEGYCLKGYIGNGRWYYSNPYVPENSSGAGRLTDDELAIARVLSNMGDYVDSGKDFYSVREAAQDRYLDIKMSEALESGETVEAPEIDW